MTRKSKIGWIVTAVIVGLIVLGVQFANLFVTKLVKHELDTQIAKIDSVTITYGDIHLTLLSRCVVIEDVYFNNNITPQKGIVGNSIEAKIGAVKLLYIDAPDFRNNHSINVREIRVEEPKINIIVSDTQKVQNDDWASDTVSRHPVHMLAAIGVNKIAISHGSVHYSTIHNQLLADVQNFDVELGRISYDFLQNELIYDESAYDITLKNISLTASDGAHKLTLGALNYAHDGAVELNALHLWNAIQPNKYADFRGKIPSTWLDVELNTLRTSPIALAETIRNKSLNLDSLVGDGNSLHIYRDVRYPAQKPYPMPQEALLQIPIPVKIGVIDFKFKKFEGDLASTNQASGQLFMHSVQSTIKNFTNEPNAVVQARVVSKLNHGGYSDILLNFHLNRSCTFDCLAKIEKANGGALNSFVRPLLGATIDCAVDKVETRFTGNKTATDGTFTMCYHDLGLKIYKEETPFEILAKNSGAINSLAKSFLPKANPRKKGIEPRSYTIHHDRNVYKNFPAYLIGTAIEGIKETVLPGFYIKERIKPEKKAATTTTTTKQKKIKTKKR